MQRCTCDMQTEEEKKEALNICSSSWKCSGASSIQSTSKEVEEDKDEDEESETVGCIMLKAQECTTQCLYNDSPFLSSCGNVLSCVAARCTTAGKTVSGASRLIMPISKEEDIDEDGKNAGCITPTANEHKIPHPLACPPPPHKKLKKHKRDQISASPFDAGDGTVAANPKVLSNFYENFFNPPPDLHTYPECIKALFKS